MLKIIFYKALINWNDLLAFKLFKNIRSVYVDLIVDPRLVENKRAKNKNNSQELVLRNNGTNHHDRTVSENGGRKKGASNVKNLNIKLESKKKIMTSLESPSYIG